MRATLIATATRCDARPLHAGTGALWLAVADDGRRVVVPRSALYLDAQAQPPRWVTLDDLAERPAMRADLLRSLAAHRPGGKV